MESREVQRNVRAQLAKDPLRQRVDLGIGVVFTRDQQRRDLEPHVRLVL